MWGKQSHDISQGEEYEVSKNQWLYQLSKGVWAAGAGEKKCLATAISESL